MFILATKILTLENYNIYENVSEQLTTCEHFQLISLC